MATPVLRPLSVFETIDAAFTLFRKHFKDLVVIAAIILVPVAIISWIANVSFISNLGDLDPETASLGDVTGNLIASLLVAVIGWVGTLVITGSVAKTIGDSYLGKMTEWRDSMQAAVAKLGRLVASAVLGALGILVGFIACFFPGVWLAVSWAPAPTTIMLEDETATGALSRARSLVSGRWWPSFGVLVVAYILLFIASLIVGGLITALAFSGGDTTSAGALAVQEVVNLAVGVVLQPFLAVVITVLYFDLRVRKEAFDLERLAGQLGGEVPPSAGSDDEGPSAPEPPSPYPPDDNPFG